MMERETQEGALDEQEISYLRLLKTLSEATEHGANSIGVVRRIATWIESSRVLEIIGQQPAWVEDWGIKEALVQNPMTPEGLRSNLERQVAVIDLLRELDGGGFSASERQEILGDARALIAALPSADRAAVQRQAYELSKSRQETEEDEAKDSGVILLREMPGADPASPEVGLPETGDPRTGSLETGPPESGQPEQVLPEISLPEIGLPEVGLPEAPARAEPAPPSEPAAPSSPTQSLESAPGESPLPFPEPVYEELTSLELDTLFPEQTPPTEPAEPSWRGDLEKASSSADPAELGRLAHSANEEVQLALVANPLLPEPAAVLLARKAGFRVAEALYRNRALFNRPRVRNALLESPHAPAAAQLQAVGHLSDFASLVRLLGSPRVRHLEVKSKARARLRSMYKALSQGEKVAAIRRSGRGILRHLWTDFFRDETLVLRCLREKQLDDGMVLEIARSRVAPRRALELIGSTSAWTSQYPVLHALVANPKTPRQVVVRLMPKLKPADRQALQKSSPMAGGMRPRA